LLVLPIVEHCDELYILYFIRLRGVGVHCEDFKALLRRSIKSRRVSLLDANDKGTLRVRLGSVEVAVLESASAS
jgi:hypothetical protein